jgi:hypothetical protein
MSDPAEKVKALCAELSIPWECLEHEPVTTVEAGLEAVASLKCAFAKNLFVKDKKHGLFLLTVTHDRKVDMKKALPELLKVTGANFRLADNAVLAEKLDVKPGAVSPLAVMNDKACEVTLVLDAELMSAAKVGVHPLRNNATLAIAPENILKFAEKAGHTAKVVDFGAAGAAAAPPAGGASAPKAPKAPKEAKAPPPADAGKKANADAKGLEYTKMGNFPKWYEQVIVKSESKCRTLSAAL